MLFVIHFKRWDNLEIKVFIHSLFIHVYSDESIWGNLISRSHLMNLRFIWANLL